MNPSSRLLLAVILCTSLGHAESPDWKRQLGDAEMKWHNRGVVDYRMTVKMSCIFCPVGLPDTHALVVTVSSGSVAAIEKASVHNRSLQDYSTVPGLFSLIERWTRDEPDVVDLAFDPKYGFPRSIRIDPDASTTDDELVVEVQAFEAVE
jgi:hypothetical protein